MINYFDLVNWFQYCYEQFHYHVGSQASQGYHDIEWDHQI